MSFDDLVHRADPARHRGGDGDPALLDRILSAGPAGPSGHGTRAALLAGGLTVAVTLSVVGGITLARDDTPGVTAGAPAAASTPPAAPVDCLALIRGWTPTYLPPGFVIDGKDKGTDSVSRQQDYVRKSARQPTSRTFVSLVRYCTDPAAQPSAAPTREPDPDFTPPPPNLTVRGHPAYLTDYGDLVRLDWEETPDLRLSLITSTDPGDTLVSTPELVRVATGLTHEPAGADPSPPPSSCPTLTSYRPATLPPGYRPGPTRPGRPDDDSPSLILTYLKGTGADQVTLLVNMACEVVIDETAVKRGEPVAINGKTGYLRAAPPVQVVWKEGPVEFWIIVGAETESGAQPTRAEVLAVARSLRPT